MFASSEVFKATSRIQPALALLAASLPGNDSAKEPQTLLIGDTVAVTKKEKVLVFTCLSHRAHSRYLLSHSLSARYTYQ